MTDTDNVSPRSAWPGRPSPPAARSSAAAPACSTTACRCARWPTRCCRPATPPTSATAADRGQPVADAGRRAGVPAHPARGRAAVTLANLTTMDRRLQNAYSRQASVEVEQQIGERDTVSAGTSTCAATHLLMSINQNVPTCVASGTNNGCRPESDLRQQQPVFVGRRLDYHGLHVSLRQRPARWGHYRVSYTLSKAMNNVGEFFFSSPIDQKRENHLGKGGGGRRRSRRGKRSSGAGGGEGEEIKHFNLVES